MTMINTMRSDYAVIPIQSSELFYRNRRPRNYKIAVVTVMDVPV